MSESVHEVIDRFREYDFLATVTQDDNGDYMLLYAPEPEIDQEISETFWNDMDELIVSEGVSHITEIANGWIVATKEGWDND